MRLLEQCCDVLCDDLNGHPLHISRPGKGDMVLVSSATYSSLIDQIRDLEGYLDDEKHDELPRLLAHQEHMH